MDFTDIFNICGTDLPVSFKGTLSVSHNGFSDRDPGVVVAEDTGILLVSRRIRGNFTKVGMVGLVSGLQKDNAVFGIQAFFYGSQGFFCQAFFHTDTCQHTEALRLNVDLAFLAFFGTNFVAESIIGT